MLLEVKYCLIVFMLAEPLLEFSGTLHKSQFWGLLHFLCSLHASELVEVRARGQVWSSLNPNSLICLEQGTNPMNGAACAILLEVLGPKNVIFFFCYCLWARADFCSSTRKVRICGVDAVLALPSVNWEGNVLLLRDKYKFRLQW